MPEARYRLSRQDDDMTSHITRMRIIMEDEDQAAGASFQWKNTPMVGPMGVSRRRGGIGSFSNFRRSSALVIGPENIYPVVGTARGRGSLILPAWYPRKPLRDITAVVRAIERRIARREEGEGLETKSPILQDRITHDPSVSTSVAQLEQDISVTSPFPTVGVRLCPPTIGKVPKILLNIANQIDEESACSTPQKKLLNNIETVERVVMEELHKLKRTPSAKKDERQKRVKTLMSMR